MNYVPHFNLFGAEAKEIPCIKGTGEPTNATAGAVGMFYMDTDTGAVYKCIAVADGVYTWADVSEEYYPMDLDIQSGYFYNRYTLALEANSGFSCTSFRAMAGDKYKVSLAIAYSGPVAIILKYDDGTHQSYYEGVSVTLTDHELVIDKDCTVCLSTKTSVGMVVKKALDIAGLSLEIQKKITPPLRLSDLSSWMLKKYGTQKFGPISKGAVCFIDDDGDDSVFTHTVPIIEEYNIPITFACLAAKVGYNSDSAMISDAYLNQTKSLINDYGCEIALHTNYNATLFDEATLRNDTETALQVMSDKGIKCRSFVYGLDRVNALSQAVASDYFDICTGGGSGDDLLGLDLDDRRSNIYRMSRMGAVNKSLDFLKGKIDDAYANDKILILYWHSFDLESGATDINKVKSVIEYAIQSGITITTLSGLLELQGTGAATTLTAAEGVSF